MLLPSTSLIAHFAAHGQELNAQSLNPIMKKYDLLQLAVLLVGIWSVYQAILFGCYLIITVINSFTNQAPLADLIGIFISDLVIMAAHLLIAWLAFTRTEKILSRIRVTERNTGIEIPAARQLLHILIVAIGLYLVAQAVPELLDALAGLLRSKMDRNSSYPQPVYLTLPVMKVVWALVLLIFARRIGKLFVN